MIRYRLDTIQVIYVEKERMREKIHYLVNTTYQARGKGKLPPALHTLPHLHTVQQRAVRGELRRRNGQVPQLHGQSL